MKAKITKGNTIFGVFRYALGPDKKAEILYGNTPGRTPRQLADEYEAITNGHKIKNWVHHTSLSQPPGNENRLSDKLWIAIAHRHLQEMGMDPDKTPYFVIRHNDRDHDHIHIIACRVRFDGRIWSDYHDVYRAIEATQTIEREFDLPRTKGFTRRSDKKRPTRAEQEAARKRTKKNPEIYPSEIPPRVRLQNLVDAALRQPTSTSEFVRQMEAQGVTVRVNIAKTGQMNGFSFELDGIRFKGSQLGKKYTYQSLLKRGLTFDETDKISLSQKHEQNRDEEQSITSASSPKKSWKDLFRLRRKKKTKTEEQPETLQSTPATAISAPPSIVPPPIEKETEETVQDKMTTPKPSIPDTPAPIEPPQISDDEPLADETIEPEDEQIKEYRDRFNAANLQGKEDILEEIIYTFKDSYRKIRQNEILLNLKYPDEEKEELFRLLELGKQLFHSQKFIQPEILDMLETAPDEIDDEMREQQALAKQYRQEADDRESTLGLGPVNGTKQPAPARPHGRTK